MAAQRPACPGPSGTRGWPTSGTYWPQTIQEEPVVYDAKTHSYGLADGPVEVDKYITSRIKTFAIQLVRLRNGSLVPAGMKFETANTIGFRKVDDSINRTIKDLGYVLDGMGEVMPARIQELIDKHAVL